MGTAKSAPGWGNVAAWSAVGAAAFILFVSGFSSLLHGDGGAAVFRSERVTRMVGVALIVSMAVVGFSNRKRPLNLRNLRNFLLQYAVAVAAGLLAVWSFGALDRAGVTGLSAWVAIVTGATLIGIALIGALTVASALTNSDVVKDEAAEDMRERGPYYLYSAAWTVACGLLLIVLGMAGPGGVLSPQAVMASALVLLAVIAVLWIVVWRQTDEFGRTLSNEAGHMAFHLILVLGGGWAMLAHLEVVPAPAPLDWLTLSVVLLFAATFIAAGRRKLLTR